MSLELQLTKLREQSRQRLGEETAQASRDFVAELKRTGIEGRALKVGDTSPDFTLPSATGEPVTLSHLLSDGPTVVSFYRGNW